MAQGLFQMLIDKYNAENLFCRSCGLYAFPGDEPTFEAVKAAKELGAEISNYRSTPFSPYIINETDLFVCMSKSHYDAIKALSPECKAIVLDGGIADPYGGDDTVYRECANRIYSAVQVLFDTLTYSIVPFDGSMVDGIAEIENECFSAPWTKESIAEELKNDTAHFLCATARKQVIGYIGVHEVAGEGYIANVAVKKQYRNRGIASALMEEAENGAKERGCEFISLEVRKSNLSAISLYEKRGYVLVGERKNFYSNPTENGLIMTLNFDKTSSQ